MSKPNHLLLFAIFCLAVNLPVFSSTLSDSLETVATNEQQTIKNRLTAYSKLVYEFEISDSEKAIQYGEDGLKLKKVDSLAGYLGELYVNIAFVYNTRQEYQSAIPYFEKAAKAYKKANNQKSEAVQYKNIGIMYRRLGNYPDAIKYQVTSLNLFEKIGNKKGQVQGLINVGNIYIFQNQFEQALPYFEDAYQLALTQPDSLVIADATNAYAIIHDKLGENEIAIKYYLEAITGYRKFNDILSIAKTEHNVALIYLGKKEYLKAEEMLLAAMQVFEKSPSRFAIEIATIKMGLGRVYTKTGRFDLGTKFLKEALITFQEKGARSEEVTTLNFLAKSLENEGNATESLLYLHQYITLKDSIQSTEIAESIFDITEKYESEKKEKEILELQNEANLESIYRWYILSISIAIISILIILFLMYRQRNIKESAKSKIRLQQYAKEMDILMEKIDKGTTQYMVPNEISFTRDDVNALLKEELSTRELDVFMLLLEGHNNKTIGEKLFVSVSTVKFHLQNIYQKLDVSNRSDAVKSVQPKKAMKKMA